MKHWHIGCSGFYYDNWKGEFYPAKLSRSKWFEYYCEHFNTLELNVTFYRFPQLTALQGWHRRSPDGFKFAIKAPKAITHFKKFEGVTELLTSFYDTVAQGLQDKLGCVLFQLPPKYGYTAERLEKIISAMDKSFTNVVEFRDESWWNEAVYKQLGDEKITFCGHSYPGLPDEVIVNTSLAYYRLHGVPQLYISQYSKAFVKGVAESLNLKRVKEAYIFFNNTNGNAALENARQMQELTEIQLI